MRGIELLGVPQSQQLSKSHILRITIEGQFHSVWIRAYFTGGSGAEFGMCDFTACKDIGSKGIVVYGTKYGSVGFDFKKTETSLYLIPKRQALFDYYYYTTVYNYYVELDTVDSVPDEAVTTDIISPIN